MKLKYDIAIVGGGAAGVMAALSARSVNPKLKICILESKKTIGSKMRITGGGRFNFTNNKDISDFFCNIVRNEKFLFSSLYSFTNLDLINFVKKIGLDYLVEESNEEKIYLKSGNAMEAIEAFKRKLDEENIEVFFNKKVEKIEIDGDLKKIYSSDFLIESHGMIISTGGSSYPQTGSDGKFQTILKNHSYKIIDNKPALVPIRLRESWPKEIAGVSLKDISISINKNNEKIDSLVKNDLSKELYKLDKVVRRGGVVFTHRGIGGPAALKISSYINRVIKFVTLEVDFIPNFSSDEIYKIIKENPKKSVFANIKDLLPTNFVNVILREANMEIGKEYDLFKDNSSNLSKSTFGIVIKYLKKCKLEPTSLEDLSKATVTSGGVDVSMIKSSTLESKIHEGVYFAGEVIDIDALTGGYNLQIAFSTGFLAGKSLAEKFSFYND
ncbi:BaiN/RdsA family NAD(P)/FAD-dependent oxidoreductase [Peptostreptococcus faecalis]|uniref:NAD(P)/FAD-dependent oxidoreductase n=1 Tax=Peptostreptococcus faecalis TaxID=2045015 RepID=UPI000C7CB8A1|nr:aminoacetone oxidase family FAD-binding enzyme [Peptostreptococcus faecalis]